MLFKGREGKSLRSQARMGRRDGPAIGGRGLASEPPVLQYPTIRSRSWRPWRACPRHLGLSKADRASAQTTARCAATRGPRRFPLRRDHNVHRVRALTPQLTCKGII